MKLFIPRETATGERRVAMAPALIGKFADLGIEVVLERGLGGQVMPDSSFEGADWADDAAQACAEADIVATIGAPDADLLAHCRSGTLLIGQLAPRTETDYLKTLADAELTAFALELVPRISRAQNMDVLSSQAAASGYYGALVAATHLPRFFPMLTTAAGTIRPAKALVIGAGVAGLQAIATAHRLGASVSGYDVRPEAREQVESLGAKFVAADVAAAGEGGYARELTDEERQAQQAALADQIAASDVVITTAMVPGKPAPRIISAEMVRAMKPGAVVVDLAADTGGNCALTVAGETVREGQATIIGLSRPASAIAEHASEMYARNVLNFLTPMMNEGEIDIDWEDEVYATSCVARGGDVVFPSTSGEAEATDVERSSPEGQSE